MYQDSRGRFLSDDDLSELEAWEIEQIGIHVSEEFESV
jgi:hypothetical protein